MKRFTFGVILLTLLAGCATVNQPASLQCNPVKFTTKGSGTIYLSLNGKEMNAPQETRRSRLLPRDSPPRNKARKGIKIPPKIEIVTVTNDKNIPYGQYVLPVYSGEIFLDALQKELSSAGFTVNIVQKLPTTAAQGFDIPRIDTDLTEKAALFKREGVCELAVTIDTWRNGAKVSSRDYETMISDYSVTNHHLLLPGLMLQATQKILSQAMPDIIDDLAPGNR